MGDRQQTTDMSGRGAQLGSSSNPKGIRGQLRAAAGNKAFFEGIVADWQNDGRMLGGREDGRVRSTRIDSLPVSTMAHTYPQRLNGRHGHGGMSGGHGTFTSVEVPPPMHFEYLTNGPSYARYGAGYPYNPHQHMPSTHTYGPEQGNTGVLYAPCYASQYPHSVSRARYGIP